MPGSERIKPEGSEVKPRMALDLHSAPRPHPAPSPRCAPFLQQAIALSCLLQLLAPGTRGTLSCSRQLGPDLEMLAARTPTPGKKAKAKASGPGRTAVVPKARRVLAVPDVEDTRKKAGKRGVKSPPRCAFICLFVPLVQF